METARHSFVIITFKHSAFGPLDSHGITSQASRSSASIMAFPAPLDRNDFEVAIICALRTEYNAAVLIFDEFWDDNGDRYGRAPGDDNIYTTGRVGSHNVVLTLLPHMGKRNAASVATSLRSSYSSLRLAILVGVCSGMPLNEPREILLGDVIISSKVVQYDFGQRNPDRFVLKDTIEDNLPSPNRLVASLLNTFSADQGLDQLMRRTNRILQELQAKVAETEFRGIYDYPGLENDKLYEPTYRHKHQRPNNCICQNCIGDSDPVCNQALRLPCAELGCSEDHLVKREIGSARQAHDAHRHHVHVGAIGSGDEGIQSASHRDEIAKETGVIAFEMEGAGIWDELPCIIVKGICDYADSHKHKGWQRFAAATSASAARAILEGHTTTVKVIKTHTEDGWAAPPPSVDPKPAADWEVPLARNEKFVGREQIISQLIEQATPTAIKDSCQRTVIEGPGGIGKTQIALETAFRIRANNPDCSVFWVAAVDAATFTNAYRRIGQLLNVPTINENRGDINSLVKAALSRDNSGPWLLVVDNADDAELLFGPAGILNDLPANNNGSILFTTRTHEISVKLDVHHQGILNISKMSNEEGFEMLQVILRPDQTQDVESTIQLIEYLDNLPLAIRLAAAYMDRVGISTRTYLGYCKLGNTTFTKILSKDFEDLGHSSTTKSPVAITWLISFERISKDYPLAGQYLKYMSFFGEHDIPQDLLPSAPSNLESDKALGALKSYAFITGQNGGFEMHRLVRLAMWNWLEQARYTQHVYNALLPHLLRKYPAPGHKNKGTWSAYLPHVRNALEYGGQCKNEHGRSNLSFYVSESLFILGKYDDAENSFRETLRLKHALLGEEHPDTIRCMNYWGIVIEKQGKYDEAEQIHKRALDLSTKVLGHSHPQTLKSMNNLAVVLDKQGRCREAEQIYRRMLEHEQTVLRTEQTGTNVTMKNLATSLRKQGKFDEAEDIYRHTLKHEEAILGKDHPSTLITMNQLAVTLQMQRKYEEAEILHRRIIQLRIRVLGEEHPDVVQSLYNLALALEQQDQYQEAGERFQLAAKLGGKVLGKDHPDTLRSLDSLEKMDRKRKRPEGSERL